LQRFGDARRANFEQRPDRSKTYQIAQFKGSGDVRVQVFGMGIPRGFRGLIGLCPSGEGECQFLVRQQYLDHLYKNGPEWKFYNLHILPEILGDPKAIFEGLRRDDFEGGYCYSGYPSKRMQGNSIVLPIPPETVAVVFVNPSVRGNVVLDWEWRPDDPDEPGRPEAWQDHFERLKWSKT
jgi:hypothetical protein